MSFRVLKNTLTPAIAKLAQNCHNPTPILQAMGNTLVSMTKRAFNDASLRPAAWPAVKKSRGAALKQSGAMWQSIRITSLNGNEVRVGTDRPYAPYHQYGTDPYTISAKMKKMLHWPGARHPVKTVHHPGLPPRPFFPFNDSGEMTLLAKDKVKTAAISAIKKLLPS